MTSAEPATGVIHDLGYQPYEGPRLGRGAIRRALFLETYRGAFGVGRTTRSKVMPILLLAAMTLPALIMVVVVAVVPTMTQLPTSPASYIFSMQVVIAIYVAGQAPAAVSRDLRFNLMSLYLSRPMARSDYVVARYAAVTAAVLTLIAVPLAVLFLGALLVGLPLGNQVTDLLLGLAVGALIAVLVAGVGLVVASVTPRRGIGVVAVVTVLLLSLGVQNAAQGIAWSVGAEAAARWFGLLSPFSIVDGIQSALLGGSGLTPMTPDEVGWGLVYVAAAGALAAACIGVLLLRYRKVSVS